MIDPLPSFNSPKNYPEDKDQYICKCFSCGDDFWGYKRRLVCKECSSSPELLITEGVKCEIAVVEVWEKTLSFRWIEYPGEKRADAVLQQKEISNLGNEKWENIERVVLRDL